MNKNEKDILGCFGIIFTILIAVIGGSIVNGWALSILWGWFIVPLFHVSQLSIPYAIGISLIVGMFNKRESKNTDNKKDITTLIAEVLSASFLPPLLILFIGWIVTLFI